MGQSLNLGGVRLLFDMGDPRGAMDAPIGSLAMDDVGALRHYYEKRRGTAAGWDYIGADAITDSIDVNNVDLNVLDFGAVGDGVADDSPAFRAAILAAQTAGGGTVRCPPSPSGAYYRLDKDPSAPASIWILNSVVPLRLRFEAGARVVFAGQGNFGAWSLLGIRASENITIDGFDGEMGTIINQDPDTGADPHHLIHLDNSGTPARDIRNIRIINSRFRYTRGDQIRAWSEAGRKTRLVWVIDCDMDGAPTLGVPTPTPNPRSCIQLQRNVENFWVVNTWMIRSHKALIDCEPTGSGEISAVAVLYCVLVSLPDDPTQGSSPVAISGNGPTEPNRNSQFIGNIVYNGGMQSEQLDRCTIADNIFIDNRTASNPTLHLNGRISEVTVRGNRIYRLASTTTEQPVMLVQHGGGATDVPSNLRIEDNDFYQEKYSSVVHIEGCTGTLFFTSNRLHYNAANYDGVTNVFHLLLETDGKTPACEPVIRDNYFGGSGSSRACAHLSANAGDFSHVVFCGNTTRQAGVGLELNRGSTFVIPSLNMQDNSNFCAVAWSKPGAMALNPVIGGNFGGVCTFETSASPEGVITAPVGCLAINKDAGTLSFKASGSGNTGWVVK